MIPNGLFTQIAMMAVSVGIIFTYVQPTFVDIGAVQDEIAIYQVERQKVAEVNTRLSSLIQQLNSISAVDQRALLTYIPDTVDSIAVPRDLKFIAEESGVFFKQATYEGIVTDNVFTDAVDDISIPEAHRFNLSVDGTYGQIKNLLRLLEQNNYPLEIRTLDIGQVDGGFLSAEVGIVTYSQRLPKPEIIN